MLPASTILLAGAGLQGVQITQRALSQHLTQVVGEPPSVTPEGQVWKPTLLTSTITLTSRPPQLVLTLGSRPE